MGNKNSGGTTNKLGRGLMDPGKVNGLSLLEDGQFAKVYKGHLTATSNSSKQTVAIKVPRVPDSIRKDKSKKETHQKYSTYLHTLVY